MELNAKQLAHKNMANSFLDKEELISKTRHDTLLSLWKPMSSEPIHIEIGIKINNELERLSRVKVLRDLIIETLGK